MILIVVILLLLDLVHLRIYNDLFEGSKLYSELAKSDTNCDYWAKIVEKYQEKSKIQQSLAERSVFEALQQHKRVQEGIWEAILHRALADPSTFTFFKCP